MEDSSLDVKSRLIDFLNKKGISKSEFSKNIGVSPAFVNSIRASISPTILKSIVENYPELNITWLLIGKGEMEVNKEKEPIEKITPNTIKAIDDIVFYTVPLLPLSAQGGSFNDFVTSVNGYECEKVLSPVKADFAMKVQGDSMSPAYPSGCTIYIKRINELIFIDWGRTYVLDTRNGSVIKKLLPSDKENAVKCVSLNPDPAFVPFDVSLSDVFGVYKVLARTIFE